MNAAPPTLPAPTPGANAAVRTAGPCAGRGGPRPIPGFLGTLTQALGTADRGITASAPQRTIASSPDGAALPQAAHAAQPAGEKVSAPLGTPLRPSAPPALEQASASAPDAENSGRSASPTSERHPASTRAGSTDTTTRTDAQQEPPPAPVALAVIPLPVPASATQATLLPGSPETDAPASDGPVQDIRPGAAEPATGLHAPAATGPAEAPQDVVSCAALPGASSQHVATVAQPLLDAPGITTAPTLAAPALPNSSVPGIAGAAPPATSPPPAVPSGPVHASIPDPAAQITPALVHIAAIANGAQHVTVRLDPVELGELRVHIERPRDGPVQVTVEATRPETLQLLHQDQPALHRALDQAGLASEGRVVVLQQASLDGGGQRQGTSPEAGTSSGGGQGNGRGANQGWNRSEDGGESTPQDHSRRRDAWLRAGIDITA